MYSFNSYFLFFQVQKLIDWMGMNHSCIESFDLIAELHGYGLNVRFLGLVVAKTGNRCPLLLEWLWDWFFFFFFVLFVCFLTFFCLFSLSFCESLSRVVKNRIRSVLRGQLKQLSGARSNLTELVAKTLESIFCFPFNGLKPFVVCLSFDSFLFSLKDAWKTENQWMYSDLKELYRFSVEDANRCVEFLHNSSVQLKIKVFLFFSSVSFHDDLNSECVCRIRWLRLLVHTFSLEQQRGRIRKFVFCLIFFLLFFSLAIEIQPSVMDAIRSNARQFDQRLQSITYSIFSFDFQIFLNHEIFLQWTFRWERESSICRWSSAVQPLSYLSKVVCKSIFL